MKAFGILTKANNNSNSDKSINPLNNIVPKITMMVKHILGNKIRVSMNVFLVIIII